MSDWIQNGELGLSVRNKLNNLYLTVNDLNTGSLSITNVTTTYTGLTTDQYIRCSGSTSGSTYNVYLPSATSTGKVLYVKNIDNGVISVLGNVDNLTGVTLTYNDATILIDAAASKWEKLK